jgi:Protein of unknown function (DUF3224)
MDTILSTRLKISSWQESPTQEFEDGSKVTRAQVVLSEGSDGLTSGTFESVMYYAPDGTSSYLTVMHLTGVLDGRSGGFVLIGDGTFDGATASGRTRIVPGSGSKDLAGITGSCESTSTHADYPFMPLTLTYRLV